MESHAKDTLELAEQAANARKGNDGYLSNITHSVSEIEDWLGTISEQLSGIKELLQHIK